MGDLQPLHGLDRNHQYRTCDAVSDDSQNGSNYVELDTNNSGMFQTITGTRCYELSFCYSARMDLSAGFNSLGFTFGDLMGQLLTNVAVKAFGNAWQQQTGQVHLNGTTSLMFNANGASDGLGRSLDNV